MDFEHLMQQASANQVRVEKKHVLKKRKKEDDKKREIEVQKIQQKKAVEKLMEMKEAAQKKQLEYKGLTSKSSRPLITSSSTMKESVKSNDTSSHKKSTDFSGKNGKNKNQGISLSSKSGKQTKSSQKERSSSPKVPKSKTDPSRLGNHPVVTKEKPSPVASFHDLLKIAQTNSRTVPKDGSVKPSKLANIEQSKSKNSSTPVGKLLLERSNQRTKARNKVETSSESRMSVEASRDACCSSSGVRGSKSKTLLSPTETSELIRRPLRDSSSDSKKTVKPHSNVPPSKMHTSAGRTSAANVGTSLSTGSTASVRGTKAPSVPSIPPCITQKQRQLKMKEAIKAHTRQVPRNKPVNATTFYGAAAARILGKDTRFSGSRHSTKYTSSWVDEMSEFLRSEHVNGDEEDEDDLDDFLDDDDFIDDSGEDNDYSSAIREIFGYDKRRFVEERYDDTAMESSYAQQEFEEKRSAKLGHLEDEEDIRMEREQLLRKRKKTGEKGRAKQMKLDF